MNDERSDAEAKLAAPKLFGRKKSGGTVTPAAEPETAPIAEPVDSVDPVAEPVEETQPLAPVPVPDVPAAEEPVETTAPVTTPSPERPKAAKPPKSPRPARERRPLPRLTGLQVAGIAGVVVGLFLVIATYGSLHLCASVRGAQTCGGKAGFPLLLAIGIVAVVGGAALLRLYAVRSPMGDSFLAVALVAVVTVLFLNNHYDAWWMLIAVPVISLVAYLLAHWVSVKYIDPVDD